ncbi:B12-binding domain-containing radical SAM protein [Methanococcoides burtonii]|nr:radical SAM protein [Methanococcoides burtonii]
MMPPATTSKDNIDINPLPPIGLGYIASVIEKLGVEVKIIDCLMEGWNQREEIGDGLIRIGLSENQIRDIISDYQPDLVCVNNQFSKQYENAHLIYRLVKEVDSNIITQAGGGHPSVMPKETLQDQNLDFVVLGEGEIVVECFLRCLLNKDDDYSKIDGLGYKIDGQIIINPKTTYIEDLDSLQFPALHLMNLEHYFGLDMSHGKRHSKRFYPIITSRGCPAKCTFCTAYRVWGRKYRHRSPENVIEEMKYVKEKYNIEELLIEDDNFTANPKRAEKICDLMIENKFNFKWDTPNGIAAFALNEKLIRKMKNAGCYKINIAVESGNQNTLNNIIKKPLKLEKVEEIVNICRKVDIDFGIFLILGMPGDNLEAMWDNYKFARKIKVFDPFISVATPYPGSEIFDICESKGYFSEEFKLENLFIRSFPIRTEQWTPEDIQKLMKKGYIYLKFYQFLDNPFNFTRLFAGFVLEKAKRTLNL